MPSFARWQHLQFNVPDTRSMSNSSLVHVFEPSFWTGELLNNFWLKDRAIFDGSIFNADPHELQCRPVMYVVFTMMLFGCTRAICELKGIYNV